jgi:hypothetical protein
MLEEKLYKLRKLLAIADEQQAEIKYLRSLLETEEQLTRLD